MIILFHYLKYDQIIIYLINNFYNFQDFLLLIFEKKKISKTAIFLHTTHNVSEHQKKKKRKTLNGKSKTENRNCASHLKLR